ncbi:hypothetical protein BZZ01_15660 [Nostocales cyanobacterium HT-58-2]|nr:hypothetical protein BZZ01_15660 [Nostocales cyanobacterium HT-58-2]
MHRCWERGLGITICGAIVLAGNSSLAQITPDSTLPNNSNVTLDSGTFNITGGTQAGANLFHSFQQFSVPINFTASFNNAADIQNIISRVTGGSISNIDGLIRANGTANLFLINPNGIIFGPNASLNIGGSFVGSTANAIQFGNSGIFSTSTVEAPSTLLTINPSALLFNQIAAAPIQNSSVAPARQAPFGGNSSGLRVPDGRSLLLVGGDIKMDGGRLRAYGGRVELGGLASPGTVGLEVNGNNLSLRFPDNATRADVSLTNGANVYVSAAGGGSIAVNARNLEMLEGSSLNAGIGQGLGSVGSVAGDITLDATGEIKIVGSDVINNVRSQAVGNGGNITISSGSFSLTDAGSLDTSTSGQGNAGSIWVRASDSVELVDASIVSTVNRGGVGNSGNININAPTFSLKDGAQLLTIVRQASDNQPDGTGEAGNVTVDVTGRVTIAGVKNGFRSAISTFVNMGATGNGGNITISSGSFSLTDGAQLATSTFGQVNAGNVSVRASDSIKLTGFYTAIFSTVEAGGVGKGGNININAATVSLFDGAQLIASTRGQGNAGSVSVRADNLVSLADPYTAIFSTVEAGGVGKGGNINIKAATLSLRDGAQLLTLVRQASNSQPAGKGEAGNVTVDVTGKVTITGVKDEISSVIGSALLTGATGNGGNITISSSSFSLTDGAFLSASTFGQGQAGSVSLRASDSVELVNGTILSTVESTAVGNGGNININTPTLSLKDGAAITASSTGNGAAGNIEVDTRSIRLSDRSTISSDTVAGQGNINLRARDLLLLRRGSNITTNATGRATGGNITINTNNLIAVAKENSNISANAQESFGGRVNINTRSIFGILFRQQDTPLSDITASSALGPQFSGSVEIDTPDVDPTQGLVELPVNLVDASQQIDTSCRPDSRQQRGSFVITGRGGLSPSPYDMLTPQAVNLNLATLEPTTASGSSPSPVSTQTTGKPAEPIVEATGWVKNDEGEIILTANLPNVTPNSSRFTAASCSAKREAE